MANQIVVSAGAKVRNLDGVLTGTSGVVNSLPINASNGIPQLDVNGKILVSQLPNSVMEYKGTWNAATNTPTLVNGTGNQGDVYLCNVAGTVDFGAGPIAFVVGDQVIYSGSIWQRASGATGTVTSVAITESGDSLNITGSPITTSGTINIGFNGTNLQYVNGAGNLTTFPTLTGYVPYTGATTNVDLGEYELKAGQLTLDVSPTGTATVGTTRWNNTIGSSETTLKGGTVILKNGVDLVARVVNKVTPNTTLTKAAYSAVRVSGAAGQRLAVAYAQANNDNNSADTIGLVIETIATNQEGFIMTVGQLLDINTTGSLQSETWVDGDVLYLSPTVAGALTNIKPTGATGHIVVMGYVEYAHAVHGSIYVKVMNGWELDELHNVYISSPLNNQGLFYNTSTSLWENKSIATALGYTPANDALVVHLAGNETIGGTKTFTDATKNNGGIFLQNASSSSLAGYMNLGGLSNGVKFTSGGGVSNSFTLPSATGYTFTFPNATGTLALTSDISYPVTSVFGRTGAVVAVSGDYTTAQVTESGNLYFTDSRARLALSAGTGISYNNTTGVITNSAPDQTVSLTAGAGISVSGSYPSFTIASTITQYTDALARAALSFAAGSGAYNSTTGVITIPTDNSQIANGAGYITSSALSGYLPLTGGTLTGALNINLSSGTALNVAGNAIFRGDTGVGTPRQLIITSGGSTPVYLEAKGYGANYQTDFGIKTFNNVGTAFEVFYADSSGRVGINQTSPSYQLDVNGTGRFSGALTGTSASFSARVLYTTSGLANGGMGVEYDSVSPRIALNVNSNTGKGYLGWNVTQSNDVAENYLITGAAGQIKYNNSMLFNVAASGTAGNPITWTTALTIASTGAATFSSSVTANSHIYAINGAISFGGGGSAPSTDPAIYRIGGLNDLAFAIGSTERMRITSGGNVGIGTSSPNIGGYGANGRILTIQGVSGSYGVLELTSNSANADGNAIGRLDFGSDGQAANYKAISSIASFLTGSTSTKFGADLRFYTRVDNAGSGDPSERMRITSTGNVGIGGTPTTKFELFGSSGNFQIASSGAEVFFTRNDNNDFLANSGSSAGIRFGAQQQLRFATGTSLTTRMTINVDGNVGIGVSSPNQKFEVQATANIWATRFIGANVTGQSYGFYCDAGTNTSDTCVLLRSNGGNTEYMWIRGDGLTYMRGNVLIGTTDDGSGSKLLSYSTTAAQQLKAAGTAPAITFSNTITSPTIGGVLGAATAAGHFITGTAAGDMVLANQFSSGALIFGTSNVERMRIINNGNISMATSVDYGYKLNLNGQPGCNGYTAWTNWSDSRLKENVTDFDATNVLDKICAIRPVTYNYNELSGFDEETRARRISGFIAQELKEIFPDMVGTIKKDNVEYYDTNLSNLDLYIVKAIQQLAAEIKTLKNK